MIKTLIKKYLMRKYNKLNSRCNEIESELAYSGHDGEVADYYLNRLKYTRDLAICYINVIISL